jgi:hypothetical protein
MSRDLTDEEYLVRFKATRERIVDELVNIHTMIRELELKMSKKKVEESS